MPTARLAWGIVGLVNYSEVHARRCTHRAIHLRWLAYRLVAPLAIDGQDNFYGTTWLLRKKEVAAAVGTMETKIQSESCVPRGSGRI